MTAAHNDQALASAESTSGWARPETLRIVLAWLLLVIGFALTAFGWFQNDDHIYHLGLTLGPAGLIVLVFEYLVRISLETQHLQQLIALDRRHAEELDGIRGQTVDSLQRTASELRQIATFDLDRGELGLVGIYANRADAVRYAIAPMIETEKVGIYVVGSTIFGLRCDLQEGPRRVVLTPTELVRQIAKRKADGCEVRILLTHPQRIFERHEQEAAVRSAERGTIASELRDACRLLTENNLADSTKLYNGSPTCFTMVFKGQRRMIVNPYPYEGEAYNSWAIMIEDREKGIYKPFLENHVEGPWRNERLAVPLTKQFTELLRQAEAQERKFADEAEALKSRQAQKTDELLSSQLPDASA